MDVTDATLSMLLVELRLLIDDEKLVEIAVLLDDESVLVAGATVVEEEVGTPEALVEEPLVVVESIVLELLVGDGTDAEEETLVVEGPAATVELVVTVEPLDAVDSIGTVEVLESEELVDVVAVSEPTREDVLETEEVATEELFEIARILVDDVLSETALDVEGSTGVGVIVEDVMVLDSERLLDIVIISEPTTEDVLDAEKVASVKELFEIEKALVDTVLDVKVSREDEVAVEDVMVVDVARLLSVVDVL